MGVIKSMFGGGSGNASPQNADIVKQDLSSYLAQSRNQLGQTYQGEQGLANQLANQAQGIGPNPAQIMLQQSTDQNAAQNAGMIASQKGINPALAQRLAAQNQATMGQQSAGQSALMGAQQQLSAQQQLGNMYGQMAGQSQNMYNANQNAISSQNSASVGNQQSINSANAQMAAGNAAGVGGLIGGVASGAMKFLAEGGPVPGHASVGGNSLKNDTVPAMLSPGEIVIPRLITQGPDAAEKAKEFIEAIKARSKKEEPSYAKVLAAHRELGKHLKAMAG